MTEGVVCNISEDVYVSPNTGVFVPIDAVRNWIEPLPVMESFVSTPTYDPDEAVVLVGAAT